MVAHLERQNTECYKYVRRNAVANKWIKMLQKMDGAVVERKDPFKNVLRSPSPSFNFIFGKGWGLPFGYCMALYGPTKGGKSVASHMLIGHLHQTDPEAIAIKFDTEMRADGQLDESGMALFGIDPERLTVVQKNSPSGVFDQIEKDIAAAYQDDCH
jgi:hypothetical protein